MFVAVLMPQNLRGAQARQLFIFYKLLQSFGREHVAFVGSPEYFRTPSVLQAEGRMEWHAPMRQYYEYEPPDTLEGISHAALPADLFDARTRRMLSPLKVFRDLLARSLPELEVAVSDAFAGLACREAPRAVITFGNFPSVDNAARRRGLPVIHNSVGPLRGPDYVMTAYWDLRGVHDRTDVRRRFRAFEREIAKRPITIFTREELLRTLRRTPVPPGPDSPDAPYRVGIPLQGEEHSYARGWSALDLIAIARERFARDQVLIRHHPSGLARYADHLGVIDDSATSAEFIVRCQTILTMNSGTALEALLLGRRCVVLGDSPFALMVDRSLDAPGVRADRAQLLALNFFVFGYLVPYPLIFDWDYVNWRLSDPPEVDIFRHHQQWYQLRLASGWGPGEPWLTLATASKLLEALPDVTRSPLVIFGAGQTSEFLIQQLRDRGLVLCSLFDNDVQKRGMEIAGLAVEAPRYQDNAGVVIASLTHADAIHAQLMQLGYPAHRIFRLIASEAPAEPGARPS